MSKIVVPPYKFLQEKTKEYIFENNGKVMTSFWYKSNSSGKDIELKQDDSKSSSYTILDDEFSEWNPQHSQLICKFYFEIKLSGFKNFIYSSVSGIAATGSKIGVAVKWFCDKSHMRGTIDCEEINLSENLLKQRFNGEFVLPAGVLIGKVILSFVLYLKEVGNQISLGKASRLGSILGLLDEKTIFLEGSGALFPIVDEYNSLDTLWRLRVNIHDLGEVFDEDVFCIFFNQKHQDYELLTEIKEDRQSTLFKEVICCALFVLIETVRNINTEFVKEVNSDDFEEDTVGGLMYYFIKVCNLDLTNPITTHKTIKKYLEEHL